MKVIYSSITAALLLASCMVGGQNQSKDNMSDNKEVVSSSDLKSAKGKVFGFYNVENLFDTIDSKYTIDEAFLPDSEKEWTSERYLTKLDNLGKVISSFDNDFPIFLGFAEIENKQVIEDLIASDKLKSAGYKIVHEQSPDKRGIDVGFIYRKDYFNYISHEAIEVSLADNPDFFTRDILYVKGELKGNDIVHVFLNHWSSRREGEKKTEHKRVRAATLLRQKVDKILADNEDAKIIIMGDFNDYPTNNSIYKVLRARKDRKFSYGDLYNTAYGLETSDNGTYNYKGDWGMLDQLIISKGVFKAEKGVTVKDKDCKILKLDWMMYTDPKYKDLKPSKTYGGPNYYGGYSDHLPIYAKFE